MGYWWFIFFGICLVRDYSFVVENIYENFNLFLSIEVKNLDGKSFIGF